GREVWHCPYCHGYEATDKQLLAVGDEAWLKGMTALLPLWTQHITWVAVEDVQEIVKDGHGIVAHLREGSKHFDQVVAQTTVIKRDDLAESLGCKRNEKGMLEIDEQCRTSVEGVFSAGDQTTETNQVNIAAGAGHRAAVAINEELGITANPQALPQTPNEN
nr:FAD-dependent oxidoreductase [bacterium]